MIYPKDFVNKFLEGDSLEIMKQIPDGAIDLVVTSPPYNLHNSTSGGGWPAPKDKTKVSMHDAYDNYKDNIPHVEYVKWQREVLAECMRLIPEDGGIFYNHKWRVQDGLLQGRQDIVEGFPVRQIIIWKRSGGFNYSVKFFLPMYEVIYLIAKPEFKLNREAVGRGDVWQISQEYNTPHPAPFPVQLADTIISSTKAQLILDPFMGSGTSAVAAKINNRDFIGIDLSPKYCEMSRGRIHEMQGQTRWNMWV